MGDLFRTIFEHTANGMLILDFEGRVLDYNSAATRLMGPGRGAFFQRTFDAFLEPDSAQKFKQKLAQLEELGHVSLEGALVGAEAERDGFLLDLCLVPWEGDSQAVLVFVRDLQGYGNFDRALLLREHALHQGDFARALYILSKEGAAEPFSGPASRDADAPKGEPASPPAPWIASLFGGDRLSAHVKKAWKGERVEVAPAWYGPHDTFPPAPLAEDSSLLDRYLGIEFVPLKDAEGDVEQILVAVEDVTEAILDLERKRRKDQRTALSLFAGVVVHELNTYLGVILAQASALRMDAPVGTLAPPAVGAILNASQNAANLLRRANEVGNEMGVSWEDIDFGTIAFEAVRILRHLFKNHLRIRLDMGEGLPRVRGDAELLRTMIIALAQYIEPCIPPGEDLNLTALPTDPTGPASGPGIALIMTSAGTTPSLRLPKVTSLESLLSRTSNDMGDPLNMAYAQAVVKKHRGQIKLDPESGQGFQVEILLPGQEIRPHLTGPLPSRSFLQDEDLIREQIAQSAENAKDISSSAHTAAIADTWNDVNAAGRPRTRILLVDDEENFRDFGREVLQASGYEVDVAVDGQEGFELFKEDPDRYTLVVLDAYMPRLGGLETALRMQVLRPELLILFASGFVRGPSLEAMLTGCPGPADVILKPFTGEEFIAAVEKMISMVEKNR